MTYLSIAPQVHTCVFTVHTYVSTPLSPSSPCVVGVCLVGHILDPLTRHLSGSHIHPYEPTVDAGSVGEDYLSTSPSVYRGAIAQPLHTRGSQS